MKVIDVKLFNTSFSMFVYKNNDVVSDFISFNGSWELNETNSLLSSLVYYSKKRNISNSDIYILDIGANIGWFSLSLGKMGYNILSFEPSKTNYYILLKNYCLNKELRMTIINKGLGNSIKESSLCHPFKNIGNAIEFTEKNNSKINDCLKEDIKLTTLNNYISFLKSKYLALIKLDIEGSEGKAIEGG